MGDDNKERECDAEELNQAYSCYPGAFLRVIVNESQKVKSALIISYEVVADLEAEQYLFLTATPMVYRPSDLQ